MKHFLDWAEETGEGDDTLRAIRRIPARLGMLDADLGALPDDMIFFEKNVAGVGYFVSTRAQDPHENGRREDSRIRAALRRYNEETGALAPVDRGVRARYDALIEIIAAEEDLPGSGARWNIGRHRSITVLRARAECAPEALTQVEIDRIGREMSAGKRKSLRNSVRFLNSLRGLLNELPALREFLPRQFSRRRQALRWGARSTGSNCPRHSGPRSRPWRMPVSRGMTISRNVFSRGSKPGKTRRQSWRRPTSSRRPPAGMSENPPRRVEAIARR